MAVGVIVGQESDQDVGLSVFQNLKWENLQERMT